MTLMNMAKAINLALGEAMERDDHVVVIGEDVGADEGVFRITEGLLTRFGEDRVIDTPVAESAIVGPQSVWLFMDCVRSAKFSFPDLTITPFTN